MEDDQGYTTLNFKERRNPQGRGQDVIEADSQRRPPSNRIVLWISGTLNILLALAVVGFGICVFVIHNEKQKMYSRCIGDRNINGSSVVPVSTLEACFKIKLCPSQPGSIKRAGIPASLWNTKHYVEALFNNRSHGGECNAKSSAGGLDPAMFPVEWHLHSGKCYYLSQQLKTWSESHKDCSSRYSRLVVIEDEEELMFLGSIISSNITNYVWIGLFKAAPGNTWTWVNGSILNELLFPVAGSADGESCGMMKRSPIESESCINKLNWICQKEAQWA